MFGRRLALALFMLGAAPFASGADSPAAPDAIATRVQALLHRKCTDRDRLVVIDRVFDIEKRLGAYRAAHTKAELIYRLNVDLWVATKDRRIRVQERSEPAPDGILRYELGSGLALSMPAHDPR
jgi:hypothetical protein